MEEQAQRFNTLRLNAESNILTYSEEQGVLDPEFEAEALLDQVMEATLGRIVVKVDRKYSLNQIFKL
ncbi:MAG: hypothetical protein P8H65_01235 [Rhodothermales bacterium]|nr:hypothetical protein [Bacteroidetes Order II. bacterium]MDG1753582.1 hypothetical protein [Rhodothermales bacterium]MDG2016266.1 hypothetical protein [Rhodothermales bacterium]HAY36967.1 hypothetical protein [Bacteroidota bacterium]